MIDVQKEFVLSDQEFAWVCRQVKARTGIHLTDAKRNLVYNRLAGRLRHLGIPTFAEYFELLGALESDEIEQFVNALTTNVTAFFRERHHFEFLADEGLPRIIERNRSNRRIRIWSAGCSSGMEPYSIAMVVREILQHAPGWDIKILATDLDTKMLQLGREGVYEAAALQGISEARLRRFVLRGINGQAGLVRMRPELKELVSFRHLNLMNPWPITGPIDAIFCRNVVIYFERETQQAIWRRFHSVLGEEGYVFIGHSESMLGNPSFRALGRTIYQKGGALDG